MSQLPDVYSEPELSPQLSIADASDLIDITEFDRNELAFELSSQLGVEPFRARQLMPWLYRRRHLDFEAMTDIAASVRERLNGRYQIFRPELVQVQVSSDGTRKYLFRVDQGDQVETVLIRQTDRWTLCVSSQVGCAIGCAFCRTGLMGLKRNLRTSEILGQVLAVQDDIDRLQLTKDAAIVPEQFQNMVFMGMGEPLHNFGNVVRSLRILTDDLGSNFSSRKITVSTSGLVPAIKKFGEVDAPANLAVSLNATTDEVRDRLIPINKRFPLDMLLGALREFPLRSRKRITIEYVMLAGVNDSDGDLERLPRLLRGIPSKINLIPYNNNTGLGFTSSTNERVRHFQRGLLDHGINATIRWSKGNDISAACGQLATESQREKKRANYSAASIA